MVMRQPKSALFSGLHGHTAEPLAQVVAEAPQFLDGQGYEHRGQGGALGCDIVVLCRGEPRRPRWSWQLEQERPQVAGAAEVPKQAGPNLANLVSRAPIQ